MNIDILIGADFYWSFMAGKARESSLGPTAVESILGWLLSAPYELTLGQLQLILEILTF